VRRLLIGSVAGLTTGLAGLVAALAVASPAAAHSADTPVASDYRCVVTGIAPPLAGLTVRPVNAGTELELVNHSGRTIEVLGYSGEPYLRVGADGVYQNANSPATYLNETLTGGVAPPASAGSAMPPAWQRLSATPAVLWHDHRVHALGAPPSSVLTNPGVPQRIRTWSVPLRDGVHDFAVTGTLDWVPPPTPAVWWAGCLLLGACVAGLGLLRSPWALPLAGVVSVLAGAAALAYALGAALDSGALGPLGALRALLTQQTWPLLCGVAAAAAGCYAALRRSAADLALGLAGACLALFAGVTNAGVFAHAVAPLPGAPMLVLVAVAGGAGLAAMTALRLRTGTTPN
jgi:hypothetical protein